MAIYINEPSHTFNEYLLIPGYSSKECMPVNVSLKTPLTKFKKGEKPAIEMSIPMVSAIMQAVSGEKLAVALAKAGGVSFLYNTFNYEVHYYNSTRGSHSYSVIIHTLLHSYSL